MMLCKLARGLVVAAVVVGFGMGGVGCAESGPGKEQGAELRKRVVLGSEWRFVKGDVVGAEGAEFDDLGWGVVSVPHTWNVEDGADGGTYYRGPGWYRRGVEVDGGMLAGGRRVVLKFGAASLVAEVYVNGKWVGEHRGGFAAFCFDVTERVHVGRNVVAVRVNNAWNKDVTPLSGDFTVYGGLYREVEVVSVPGVGVSMLDEGSCGVYLTPGVEGEVGTVGVKAEVRNAMGEDSAVEVVCVVRDGDGKEVGRSARKQVVRAGRTEEAKMEVAVASPRLWDGRRDPYLYRAAVEVWRDGVVVDRVEQPVGFRSFRVNLEKGFVLNGRGYDLHGVNKHQGRPGVGWADTAEMREEDFRWIEEMGCTAVRLAHYQHPEDEYAICDEKGIVVWAELALVNRMTDSPGFRENAKQQLRELIKQGYNHPSIAFWSMYNEPAVNEKSGTQEQWKLVDELVKLSHELDPGRLTTGAADGNAKGAMKWYMDTTGENRYWGWYGGKGTDWKNELAKLKATGRKVGVSEYGAGASVRQHEVMTTASSRPSPGGKWHPEEWQGIVHEQAWGAMKDAPWLWGKFIWVMFDFASDGRNEGDHAGINDKGLVTGDRKVAKDAFYFYKANWSERPVVWVTERRFGVRRAGRTTVKVYSNCEELKLWVGGNEVALRAEGNCVFVGEVELTEGACKVRAVGKKEGKLVEDEFGWEVGAK